MNVVQAHHHEHGIIQEWIEQFYSWLFHLTEGDKLLEVISHFTYDLIRTFFIFVVVLVAVSWLKTYIPIEKVRCAMAKLNPFAALMLAALSGFVASACICTNIPLFFGFIAFGIPLHLAMTYLISASLINAASLLPMFAMAGWKFTLVYLVCCLIIAVVTGFCLSFVGGEKYLYQDSLSLAPPNQDAAWSQRRRWGYAVHELKHTMGEQWAYIVLGVLISALINGFMDFELAQKISDTGFLGVFFVTVLGIIPHTDVVSLLPVISSLLQLNVTYGIIFSLVVSLAFFSLPMLVMVKRTMKLRYIWYTWGIMFVLTLVSGGLLLVLF